MSDSEMRELDAWIAEHVMNWLMHENARGSLVAIQGFNTPTETNRVIIAKHPWDACEWSPTTDASAAMEVLRKCCEKAVSMKDEPDVRMIRVNEKWNDKFSGYEVGLMYYGHEYWGDLEQRAETLELAICKFAKSLFSK